MIDAQATLFCSNKHATVVTLVGLRCPYVIGLPGECVLCGRQLHWNPSSEQAQHGWVNDSYEEENRT